ncbi:MAG: glycosyltransferase [bacterium]|nr:glycosyltransferase [bacterium]
MCLRKRVREQHFDVVHAHYGLTGLPARMQFACPIVLTYHGSDLLGQVGPEGNYTASGRLKVLLSKLLGFTVNDRIIVASPAADSLVEGAHNSHGRRHGSVSAAIARGSTRPALIAPHQALCPICRESIQQGQTV